jgi:hypothetical protein
MRLTVLSGSYKFLFTISVQKNQSLLIEFHKNFLLQIQNRKWLFEAKIPYNLVAADLSLVAQRAKWESGANSQNLTNSRWYPIPVYKIWLAMSEQSESNGILCWNLTF